MTKLINNLNISSIYIPLGMCRSVEWNNNIQTQHPAVRDASLSSCVSNSPPFGEGEEGVAGLLRSARNDDSGVFQSISKKIVNLCNMS
jgi:hypothetical protein